MSYETFSNLTTSEKIITAWIEPKQQLINGWDNSTDPIYTYASDYYIIDFKVNGTSLTLASSAVLSAGEYFYDNTTSILYVRLSDGSDPALSYSVIYYRLFYSNKPLNWPYDLNTGRDVPYEGILDNVSKFKQQIDVDDQIGISLSGNGSISFINTGGVFDEIYDKLFWENSRVLIYSASTKREIQIIYKGFVDSKSYSDTTVTFRIKDVIDRLRDEVNVSTYQDSDGTLPETTLYRPKRRIYGRAAGVRTVSLDQVVNGFTLTGTFTGVVGASTVTGNSSILLTELSPGDTINYTYRDELQSVTVKTIESDTGFTLTSDIEQPISGTLTVKPKIPYSGKNRTQYICGHQVKEVSTTISSVISLNRFIVADSTDFEVNDTIYIGTTVRMIKRISSNEIILTQNLNSLPAISTTVTKQPVQSVYNDSDLFVVTRDYTITNNSSGCKVTLETDAEFNVASIINFPHTMVFTQSSRTVTGTGFDQLQTRDWISPNGVASYYEILQIESDTELKLRTAFVETNTSAVGNYKRPNYINDNSPVHVNCLGKMDASGNWIKTGAAIIKDLCIEIGLENDLDTNSFDQGIIDCPYLMSIVLPESNLGSRPKIKDVIDKVNKSILGSVYYDSDYNIAFKALNPKKPAITEILRDDDIISFSVNSTGQNVVKSVASNYRFVDYDINSKSENSLSYESSNDFVEYVQEVKRIFEIDLYLYNSDAAETITERYGLIKQLANVILSIQTGLKLQNNSIKDLLYFDLDRLFTRFGTTSDKNKIGVISSIAKDGDKTELVLSDIGGFYDRVATFAISTANDYASSTTTERAITGYFTDTNSLVNDNQDTYLTNVFG